MLVGLKYFFAHKTNLPTNYEFVYFGEEQFKTTFSGKGWSQRDLKRGRINLFAREQSSYSFVSHSRDRVLRGVKLTVEHSLRDSNLFKLNVCLSMDYSLACGRRGTQNRRVHLLSTLIWPNHQLFTFDHLNDTY